MKKYLRYIALSVCLLGFSCEDLVDDINENPNEILPEEIEARLFLSGAMLANNAAQAGHLKQDIRYVVGTACWTNFPILQIFYGYSISTAESVGTWARVYIGMIPNLRHIRTVSPDDALLVGISKVLEAQGIGTIANLMGDVPYTEVNDPEIEDPKFDDQISVLTSSIALLESAISDLSGAESRPLTEDLYFEGDAERWIRVAWTLKARYHMHMKDFAAA